jgi:hypothetical protein
VICNQTQGKTERQQWADRGATVMGRQRGSSPGPSDINKQNMSAPAAFCEPVSAKLSTTTVVRYGNNALGRAKGRQPGSHSHLRCCSRERHKRGHRYNAVRQHLHRPVTQVKVRGSIAQMVLQHTQATSVQWGAGVVTCRHVCSQQEWQCLPG